MLDPLLNLVGNAPRCSGEEERLIDLVGDPLRVPGGEEMLLADQPGTQTSDHKIVVSTWVQVRFDKNMPYHMHMVNF